MPDTFKKAVQVIHSMPFSHLSLLQKKMLNAWLKHAAIHKPDSNGWWQLRLDAMSTEIDFNSNNRPHLKESAENLMRIVFQWDVIAPEAKRVQWKASVLFPDVEISSEFVRYRINEQLIEQVLRPEVYAWIDQGVLRKYRRSASIGIYEHCMRYARLGKTATVEWEKFRSIIMGESANLQTYQQYKFFKAKVLLPAIKEINTEGALLIELHEIMNGREVFGIFFAVKIPKANTELLNIDEGSIELVGKLTRLGVPPSEAKRLVREHTSDDIAVALDYTSLRKANKKAEKLVNAAAYFRKALMGKWKPTEDVSEDVTDVVEKKASPKPARPDVNALFKQHQMSEAEKYFAKLDLEDQSASIERYNGQQAIGALMVKSKNTKVSQSAFQQWLVRDLWGEPEPAQILAFAENLLLKQSELLDQEKP